MNLTTEQRKAVLASDNALIVACPGSGKTRTIIAKLIRCIDDVRGTPRKVACITYTNAAVDEIEDRFRVHGAAGDEDYCEVSTIHTFCLANVLARFYWHLPQYENGFRVAPPDSQDYVRIAKQTLESRCIDSTRTEELELINREPDGTPTVSGAITAAVANQFWERLEQEGLVDFPNIVYWSYQLMVNRASISHALACRFAWILVDEFQDTSALQVEILKLIAADGRTRFCLVGDPHQSIYGFAGARPSLMDEFADVIAARRDFSLSGNFRSSPAIISHAERLLPRTPPMEAVGNAALLAEQPFCVDSDDAFQTIISRFLKVLDGLQIPYGRCAILAPSWFFLFPLGRRLSEYGVPVFGIGARPYKRQHVFALLAEQICSYIAKPSPEKIAHVERELFFMLARATGNPNYRVFSYSGRRMVFRLLKGGERLKRDHRDAVGWLRAAASHYQEILSTEEFLPRSCSSVLSESVCGMCEDMQRRRVDTAALTTDDLGLFADPAQNLKLLTIHGAKGREFDGVAIVDLQENHLPHWSANTDLKKLEESKRVFYVAITRARRVLMYVTNSDDLRNPPSRFLSIVLAHGAESTVAGANR